MIKLGSGISKIKKKLKNDQWNRNMICQKKKKKHSRIEIRLINKINKTQILLGMKKTDLHL